MKIRNPKVLRAISWLGARAMKAWIGTVHYQQRSVGPCFLPFVRGVTGRYIYAFWHEHMLLPAYHYSRPDVHVLISTHSDGQLITDVAHQLGLRTVRGSTTRGGTEAMRQLLRLSRQSHIVITPDGPRGPRRVLQPGIVYLAAKTGLPIVTLGFGYSRAWRVRSWDRMAVPRPFSKGYCVTMPPIAVPRNVTPDNLEPYRTEVERSLRQADAIVEHWASSRHFEPHRFLEFPMRKSA